MQQTAIDRQIQLEAESSLLGVTRYKRALEGRDESNTSPGKRLIAQAIVPVAQAIQDWVAEADTGRPGRRHSAVRYLKLFDPHALAYMTAVCCVNALGGNSTRIQSVASSIYLAVEDEINYQAFKNKNKAYYSVIQKAVKKSTSTRHTRAVMGNALNKAEVERFEFTMTDGNAVGLTLIDLFISSTGFIETISTSQRKGDQQVHIRGTEKILEWLNAAHESAGLFSPLLQPMVAPPRPWTTPTDGGYYNTIGRSTDLVRTRNKAYKRELEQADMPRVYAAVNAVQATPWKINTLVLDVMESAWKAGGRIGGLPDRELIQLPDAPLGLIENEEHFKTHHKEEFTAWKRERSSIYEANARSVSQRVAAGQKISIAARFRDEEAIYFPHNLDFRGRVYPLPPLLNPQGDDQAKALLCFSKGVALGEDGSFWLAVHLANCFGVDKVSFEERVAWVKENEDAILDSAIDPLDGQRFWETADSPWCALAACFEWAGFVYNGPEHISHIAVALDGSCNGLQNFSAMLKDSIGGKATNLLPADIPADIYTEVMKVAQARISELAKSGDASAVFWDGQLSRKLVKTPVMTLPYGVTRSGMRAQILEAMRKEGIGDDWGHAEYLAGVLWACIGEVVVAAQQAMDWLRSASKAVSAHDLPISWTTPVGFPVLQEYREDLGKRVQCHIGGRVVDIKVSIEGTKLDRKRQTLGISPNFVHSCDASHLMLTTLIAADNGVTDFAMIHDSYGTHAGNTSVLAAALREAFVEQYDSDVLGTFRNELISQLDEETAGAVPPLPPTGDLDLALVKESKYFFA